MPKPRTNICSDPIHGYIPFTAPDAAFPGEVFERQIIDHPWVQRMRFIHQLQTAWWVYPSAEHTRFPHILGAMHLASRAVGALYDSLTTACPDVPSRGYVESLMRLAGLLHDVGHGPFGHFFDEHYLKQFGQTHETIGAQIIRQELGDLIRKVRRNPHSELAAGEQLDPQQIASLVTRPRGDAEPQPQWLIFLRSLLSGIYTIDNIDFVLRDAFMTGFSPKAFDVDRLLEYSFFSSHGLTMHERGVDALVRFINARSELFRNVYFHRTVRGIDLALKDLFLESRDLLFQGNPLDRLDDYLHFHEFSVLTDVARWKKSSDSRQAELGRKWELLIHRKLEWVAVCQRDLMFGRDSSEQASLFSDASFVEAKLRERLPAEIRDVPLRVDIARTIFRPHTQGPAQGQNFLYDAARDQVRPLTANQFFHRLPISHRICRVYARDSSCAGPIASALDDLLGSGVVDDLTNM